MKTPLLKYLPLAILVLFISPNALAGRSCAFGVDAFNASIPANAPENALFSPYSFELDCVALAEAFDSIGRANIAERMGVLTDFEGLFQPLIERYEGENATNGIHIVTARTLCLPNVELANIDYRQRIWDMSRTSVCFRWPTLGAESWLKAKMDGEMEDFSMPSASKAESTHYSFVDLVAVRAAIPRLEDAVDGPATFRLAEGKAVTLPFVKLCREVAFRKTPLYQAIRLELENGALMYLAQPAKSKSLSDVRSAISGDNIADFFAAFDSITLADCGTAKANIFIPCFTATTKTDLAKAFIMAKVPQSGFVNIANTLVKRDAMQCVKFSLQLGEGGSNEGSDAAKPQAKLPVFAFNSPFFFIVRFPDTEVSPVIGQFTGKDSSL